jgi:glycine/D-amino acid oxidase-like deaminating enzyme
MAHVLVVGAGVFGAWSALELARAGHQVTLVDAYGPGNGRASSADHSRVMRAGYGRDAIYSEWAVHSCDRWLWLSAEAGTPLFEQTGALFMGAPGHEYIRETHATLSSLGIPVEWLDTMDVDRRWPQIATTGLGPAVYEPSAGVLRARPGVRAVVKVAIERYQVIYATACVSPLDESRSTPMVDAVSGQRLDADAYVIACGPWLPGVLPAAVGDRIRATRQEVLYFGIPPGDKRHGVEQLPVWIDFGAGLYGIPDFDGYGFKVGIDRHGPPLDPGTADRLADPEIVSSTRSWLSTRFPAMAGAPLVDARVCQYESSSTGDFIIDRHPAWPNVWIVGGGSGHGFKHGPAVGRYVADLIDGRIAPNPRFALETKTGEAERTVY